MFTKHICFIHTMEKAAPKTSSTRNKQKRLQFTRSRLETLGHSNSSSDAGALEWFLVLGARTERRHSALQGPGAEICAHYSYLQTLTSSHCPSLPPNCHIPLHYEVWLPSFSGPKFKKWGGKRRNFMQRKRQARCPIWILLSSEQAFDWTNMVQVSGALIWRELNIKSPWMAPGQSAGVQVFSPPSCPSACLTEITYIAYR